MDPWYRVVTPRSEVREGRSFSPDEFAIALEQVVAGTAPPDYSDPSQFFSRTYFTRALTEHSGMVLKRLSGRTENTSPVLTLITQFGGGKTHTLTSLFHLANAGVEARSLPGASELMSAAGLSEAPAARVGVFVGNAWDPADGRETPWIDLARQLAGEEGVSALGNAARTTPPGTEALARVFSAANAPVLLLFDEALNFVNRHRGMADSFHAFLQNLTVAVTGATHAAAVISLPRSQVEMTAWDQEWQERITKVVRRVARDLIANDESEISEVVRRRLFEDLGSERTRRRVAQTYADWCFERSARLPSEWTAVDSATTGAKARDFLRSRFEACYPFHPATLSVFQRKWRALPQFQQTRGALAMLAQWISWASKEQFQKARTEPLITLGSAPLDVSEFRAVVLGQLGEQRLDTAIDADVAGDTSHASALDVDIKGAMRALHRRVGTAMLFESSGGQVEKVAHLPELRFALGEPEVDTASIDNAATALEKSGFFIRKVGTDGYRIHHQATLRKVVSDRRASLDEDEVNSAVRKVVQEEFARGASVPVVYFPEHGDAVQDSPRLTMVVVDPAEEWHGKGQLMDRLAQWTRERGESPRLYPGALVWCARKPGRELRESVEQWLAWRRVAQEVSQGVLGAEFDQTDRAEVQTNVQVAEDAARDEVWAGYRFAALQDAQMADGLRVIDLGAGHSSGSETLCGRVINALKSGALLNESVGAGYIARHWPPVFKESEAWPLNSLRQSFLNGALTRLLDPDAVLRMRIVDFVNNGDFGLASIHKEDGNYERVWFREPVEADEVVFESGVFLLTKARAELIRSLSSSPTPASPEDSPGPDTPAVPAPSPIPSVTPTMPGLVPALSDRKATLRIKGTVPPEVWNRLGTRILPKLRSGDDLSVGVEFSVSVDEGLAHSFQLELRQALDDLGLLERVSVENT
ncbi:MAG: ATP-binding protein [Dehalococcoidia bacterium]|nr:ATP-binding protein [Dehalococcoidia bacterium]